MPRANRHFLPGHVWHITHRCHNKEFLLKFAKDRQRWLHWLFEAKRRYGLCVLNYVVTSNHIHLLVKDTGEAVIPKSLKLIAGRTGQEYNQRKSRKGAYWEDRYHATAVAEDKHFSQCLTYIDLNMVRAGVVHHPKDWFHGGYREIQSPPMRYRIIDIPTLITLCGTPSLAELQRRLREWVEQGLAEGQFGREEKWSTGIAVGDDSFIERVKSSLAVKAPNKQATAYQESDTVRQERISYDLDFDSKKGVLRGNNGYKWNINPTETYS